MLKGLLKLWLHFLSMCYLLTKKIAVMGRFLPQRVTSFIYHAQIDRVMVVSFFYLQVYIMKIYIILFHTDMDPHTDAHFDEI